MTKAIMIVFMMGLISSAQARRGEFKQIRIAACENLSVGDSCSFEGKRGEVNGVCKEGKRNPEVKICHNPNRQKRRKANKENNN